MRWFLPGTARAQHHPDRGKAGGNYLFLLVGSEARRHGYQEGIALDVNGYISEGAGENLFEVKDGVLFTPPFTSSALPGITRDAIIKLAKDLVLKSASRCCPVNPCTWRMKCYVRYRGGNHAGTQR
jgi:branched-subunit amino acid aminotransferase/4-amino-4-deoxychorismate lyase